MEKLGTNATRKKSAQLLLEFTRISLLYIIYQSISYSCSYWFHWIQELVIEFFMYPPIYCNFVEKKHHWSFQRECYMHCCRSLNVLSFENPKLQQLFHVLLVLVLLFYINAMLIFEIHCSLLSGLFIDTSFMFNVSSLLLELSENIIVHSLNEFDNRSCAIGHDFLYWQLFNNYLLYLLLICISLIYVNEYEYVNCFFSFYIFAKLKLTYIYVTSSQVVWTIFVTW
jgi:hypothetical protein